MKRDKFLKLLGNLDKSTLTTEELIERLNNPDTPYHKLNEYDSILFNRAEKGDRLAESYYIEEDYF